MQTASSSVLLRLPLAVDLQTVCCLAFLLLQSNESYLGGRAPSHCQIKTISRKYLRLDFMISQGLN